MYDLFERYQSDYKIDEILAGEASEEIRQRAGAAKVDERIALLGLDNWYGRIELF